jgi:hypothetical protein
MPGRVKPPDESPKGTGLSLRSLPNIYRKSSVDTKGSEPDRGNLNRPRSVKSGEREMVWSQKLVLCLDGGGGSGLSQLLILRSLMQLIRKAETAERDMDLQPSFELLPCHYFDYICGTSTGGLLAIMLGLLRLSVETCLLWMGDLEKVCSKEPGMDSRSGQRDLFRGVATDKSLSLLQEMVKGKIEEQRDSPFLGNERMCRTIAMCLQKENGARTPYMFRSYKARRRTPGLLDRNLAVDRPLRVAEVISAIAASKYCSYSSTESFMDGSLEVNNPSYEVFNEICSTHRRGDEAVRLLLSIGSGDLQRPRRSSLWTSLRSSRNHSFNMMRRQAESVHETMQKISHTLEACEYYRLSVPSDDLSFGSNLSIVSMKSQMQRDGVNFLKRSNSVKVATEDYLKSTNAQFALRSCAEFLVRRRRERTRHSRWDTFAGLAYQCREPDCTRANKNWEDQGEFMNHLHDVHRLKYPDLNHFEQVQKKLDDATVIIPAVKLTNVADIRKKPLKRPGG